MAGRDARERFLWYRLCPRTVRDLVAGVALLVFSPHSVCAGKAGRYDSLSWPVAGQLRFLLKEQSDEDGPDLATCGSRCCCGRGLRPSCHGPGREEGRREREER